MTKRPRFFDKPPDRIWIDTTHWYKASSPAVARCEYVHADIFKRETDKLKEKIKELETKISTSAILVL